MESDTEPDVERIALRGVGLNRFPEACFWFIVACRYDRLLTSLDMLSLPFHRQGDFPQNLLE